MEQIFNVTVTCIHCGKKYKVQMFKSQYDRILNMNKSGEHIQDIIPEVPAGIREIFISRTCPTCWDEIFKFDGDIDD